jgi:tetratricopeptide (TPR) repeat protein
MGLFADNQSGRVKPAEIIGVWAVLFLVCFLAYFPGLGGPFVLDDVLNISALGDHGGVTDWETFKAFVFGGHSGPTGRPVSLLTFLIDASNWPADPSVFKRTNLIIHLFNGALLGVLVGQVVRLLQYRPNQVRWIALICAGGWLLHPFLVSTTLYVVQRMAQLSTLFIFAGLAGYLYGRTRVAIDRRKAYLIMTASIGVFTALATLSKENGIVLPLLAGVLEVTVVASQSPRLGRLNTYWRTLFFVVPAASILIYLVASVVSGGFFELAPSRDFSIYERLLTQSRVLVDYQVHWFVPDMYTPGIFQDHFTKSTGWFSPLTTIVSGLFHLSIIAGAINYRHRWPLLALAILFFYASHVLESTVLNLELYFEHRNYLASAFLFLPVVVALDDKLNRRYFALVAAAALLVLAGFTRYSATIWSDYSRMIEASAKMAPTSVRAQARYATILFDAQQYEESLNVLDVAIAEIPGDHSSLLVNRLLILCNLGILDEDEFDKSAPKISKLYFNPGQFFLYRAFSNSVALGRCPGLAVESLQPMFSKMLAVPANSDSKNLPYSQLNYLLGFVAVHAGDSAAAKDAFTRSLAADPRAAAAMSMARLLAANRFYDGAMFFSDRALVELQVEDREGPVRVGVSAAEIHEFQAELIADRDAQRDDDRSGQDR